MCVDRNETRIYAPSEHSELPSQLASTLAGEAALREFIGAYGRLGLYELRVHGGAPAAAKDVRRAVAHVYDETLAWIEAHARTVAWCLAAIVALQNKSGDGLQTLRDVFPQRYAIRATTYDRPTHNPSGLERVHIDAKGRRITPAPQRGLSLFYPVDDYNNSGVSGLAPREGVARLLADTVVLNMAGVHRDLKWRGDERGLLHFWGGVSLIESVYTPLADAAAGGCVARCETPGCGGLFIQTHRRQTHCPPRTGQDKSPCATRWRMRRHRAKQAETRNAGARAAGVARTLQGER